MIEGQQITSTLRLVRLLGQGGMGSVWIADHLGLGTQVAVKFMAPAFAENAAFVQRFRREAMAAAQIKSPHIAQVFDHGVTADNVPYIVMELLEGEELKARVRRVGALDLREVAAIITQAAKALTRAHQLGIVHRDIKPDNIFVTSIDGDMLVKLLDFGIAKQISDAGLAATSTGSMLGTPLYMSPEQLLSAKHVDFRSDLWSLGVVAYFAVTGQVPFSGETLGSLSVAVHAGVFPLPSAVRPGIPPAIDAWFQRILQRDPAARFGSAREMAEALEHAVNQPWYPSPDAMTPPPSVHDGGAPRAPQLSSSGVTGRTFTGASTTGAGSGRGRTIGVIAALGIGAAAALAVGLWAIPRRPIATAAAPSAGTSTSESAPISSAGTSSSIITTAGSVAPGSMAPAEVTAEPSPEASPRPAATAGPASASTIARSSSSGSIGSIPLPSVPAKTAISKGSGSKSPVAPAPSKDTIGF